MADLRSSLAALAIGLAPGFLVLSTSFMGCLSIHCRDASAESGTASSTACHTNHDLRSARVNANVSDLLEPDRESAPCSSSSSSLLSRRATDRAGPLAPPTP